MDPAPSFTTAGIDGSLEAAPLFDVVKMTERPGRVLSATYRFAISPICSTVADRAPRARSNC